MFPVSDFISLVGDMQGMVNGVINQSITMGVKMVIILAIIYLALFLVPRGARFFAGLALLAAVWFYPVACNRLLDAVVAALAGMGLVPQVHFGLLHLAGL